MTAAAKRSNLRSHRRRRQPPPPPRRRRLRPCATRSRVLVRGNRRGVAGEPGEQRSGAEADEDVDGEERLQVEAEQNTLLAGGRADIGKGSKEQAEGQRNQQRGRHERDDESERNRFAGMKRSGMEAATAGID